MKNQSTISLRSIVPNVSSLVLMLCTLMLAAWVLGSSTLAQTVFPDRSLVKGSGDKVYIMANGKACWIPNPLIFNSMGLDWDSISTIADKKLNTIPKAPLLLKGSEDKVYIIEGETRRWITSASIFEGMGLDWSTILLITDSQLRSIPEGSHIENGITQQTIIPDRSNEPSNYPPKINLTLVNATGNRITVLLFPRDRNNSYANYNLSNKQQITVAVAPTDRVTAYDQGSALSNYEFTSQPNQTFTIYKPKYVYVNFNNQTGGIVDVYSTNPDGSLHRITLKSQDFAISTSYIVGQTLRFEQNEKELNTYTVLNQNNQQIIIGSPKVAIDEVVNFSPPSKVDVVSVWFYNDGYSAIKLFKFNPTTGQKDYWGGVASKSESIVIPTFPGDLWSYTSVSGLWSTQEIRITSETNQRYELIGFLANAEEPPPDKIRMLVGDLKRNVDTWVQTTNKATITVTTGIRQIGKVAEDAGSTIFNSFKNVNWCQVGTELGQGITTELKKIDNLYQEIDNTQKKFLKGLNIPEGVSPDPLTLVQMLQPDLDNLLQPVIDSNPQFLETFGILVEGGQTMNQISVKEISKAVCGDYAAIRTIQEFIQQFAHGQSNIPKSSGGPGGLLPGGKLLPGWMGFVYTMIDVGGGFGAQGVTMNMQHSIGVLIKLSDLQILNFYSVAGGVMVGGGVSASVRFVYIPFDVSKSSILESGWSVSSSGFWNIFDQSPFSLTKEKSGTTAIELFGGGDYCGFSIGPQLGIHSSKMDVTFSYTHTIELKESRR